MKLFNTFFRSILASLGITYDNHVFNHSIKCDLNESTKEYDDHPNIKSIKKKTYNTRIIHLSKLMKK